MEKQNYKVLVIDTTTGRTQTLEVTATTEKGAINKAKRETTLLPNFLHAEIVKEEVEVLDLTFDDEITELLVEEILKEDAVAVARKGKTVIYLTYEDIAIGKDISLDIEGWDIEAL